MSEEIKKLIVDLGTTFEQFKIENDARVKAIEAKGVVDPLLTAKIEAINKDLSQISAMKTQLEALETVAGRPAFGGDRSASKEAQAKAKAFKHLMQKGDVNSIKDMDIQAAASTLSDPDGGFTVPEEVETSIDRVALTVSAMRRLCSQMTIGTDTYKKLVGVGGATAGWVAEKGARPETDTPTLVEIAINTKELYAMPAATQALLDDSRVDIGAWLSDEVSISFAEQENPSFITGNGVEKPKGIAAYTMVANASYAWGKVGFIAGGHATLLNNMDKLIDLQHALKAVYRNGAAWLMNDLTLSVIRKFKDGEGNYLWRPGLLENAPDTLLGKPVEIDDNVADIGAGAFPIFFANFKRAYLIIDRQGVRVLRDPYTNKPYVMFYTTKRVGGGLVMYEALKALKISA